MSPAPPQPPAPIAEAVVYRFGPFRFDAATLELFRGEEGVPLPPQPAKMLSALLSRPGELWTKDALRAELWGDSFVEVEQGLHSTIRRLRRALDDSVRRPRYLETLTKRGYRFVGEVTREPRAAEPRAEPAPTPPETAPTKPAIARLVAALLVLGISLAGLLWWIAGVRPTPTGSTSARPRLVSASPGLESHPTYSPDGTKVAFSQDLGNDQWAIVLQDRKSGSQQRWPRPGAYIHDIAWSPSGERLVWLEMRFPSASGQQPAPLSRFAHSGTSWPCRVVELQLNPERIRDVAACGDSGRSGVSFTADGSGLIFATPDLPGLGRLDLGSDSWTPLTFPAESQIDRFPAIRTDGLLAFARWEAVYEAELHVAEPGSRSSRVLTDDGAPILGVDFLETTGEVLFSSNRGSTVGSLWLIDPEGGDARPIHAGAERLLWPKTSTDGRFVIVEEQRIDTDLVQVSRSGETGPALAVSTRIESLPRLSPSGHLLAFLSMRSGQSRLWLEDLANPGHPRPIGGDDLRFAVAAEWSPDGSQLAFEAHSEGNFDLWLYDPVTDESTRLREPVWDERYPTWSRDGTALYFVSSRQGGWHAFRRDLATGETVRVSERSTTSTHELVDGLLLVDEFSGSAWVDHPAGSRPLRIPIRRGYWRFANDRLYTIGTAPGAAPGAGAFTVTRYSLDSEDRPTSWEVPGVYAPFSFDIDPGERLIGPVVRSLESDLRELELHGTGP